ncbi:F-box/LRR-repeat protein 18-like [Asterias amurensis]|uniref:F-box/LRR-repeat protein 18-like n=1 Tax=Asterias amurensis TaxID=7602 RepID=UPI003AB816E0
MAASPNDCTGICTNSILTLDSLPDEILLTILSFLPISDALTLTSLGPGCHLGRLANDPSLFRSLNLSKCYYLTRRILEEILLNWRNTIQSLDISNCYWLTKEDLSSLDFRLPNLVHLGISNTAVEFETLHRILHYSSSLRRLSYSQNAGINGSISQLAARTLNQLQELHILCSPKKCINEIPFAEYCPNLTAFSINAAYRETCMEECMCTKPLNDVVSFQNLIHFKIGRRVLGSHRSMNLNAVEYSPNQQTVLLADGCFKLPISEVKDGGSPCLTSLQMTFVPDLKTIEFSCLKYLNIAGNVNFTDLNAVAENCRHLETLNISFCTDVLKTVKNGDMWTDLSAFHVFIHAKTPLKYLNISGMHPHLQENQLCQMLALLPGLVSVSMPVCGLPERQHLLPTAKPTCSHQQGTRKSSTLNSSNLNKCSRCSRVQGSQWIETNKLDELNSCVVCSSDLSSLVIGCRKIQSFELIKTGFVSVLSPPAAPADEDAIQCGDVMEPEDSLLCISLWHYLQSLVLAGIPSILHGYSLISITKGCTMLTSLSLSHLGPYPYDQCFFIQNLCQAMTYAKQLRDFRFEQPKIVDMKCLLQSLKCCTRLTRFCLITQTGKIKEVDELVAVMEHCCNLMVLQVISSIYFGTCLNWQKAIMDKYSACRPALHVMLASYKKTAASDWRDVYNKIPFIHLEEFTLFQTRVATSPPSWQIRNQTQEVHTVSDK